MAEALTQGERRLLVDEAGRAILARLKGQPLPSPPPVRGALALPRGVFVSLHAGDALRGCIGTIEGRRPVIEETREMALAAAFRDPRFPPLRLGEVEDPGLRLEVSCLSPLRRFRPGDAFTPGEDGLYLRQGAASGLLLPQVAEEMGWDRTTFFEHTAMKAGLPRDGWEEAELWTFRVEREEGRLRSEGVTFEGG